MNFGDIIKRSWKITWRYKALWVLGLFAGLSGCQSSGGGGNYGGSSGGTSGFDPSGFGSGYHAAEQYVLRVLPFIIAASLLFLALGVLWSILSVAARAGLVVGADEADRGRHRRLGELWAAGFQHFWRVIGLGIVLKLPAVAAILLLIVLMFAPFAGMIAGGVEPSPAALLPACGVLVIGLPVVVVLTLVLDVMYLLGLRYVVLGGQGVMESARNGWRFFRARFKDTFLIYAINGGLNIAASFVLAIPMVLLALVLILPVIAAFQSGDWSMLALPVSIYVALVMAASFLYTGIWGTFTSALWTLFFRAAMEPAAQAASESLPVAPGPDYYAPAELPLPPASAEPIPTATVEPPVPPAPIAPSGPDA